MKQVQIKYDNHDAKSITPVRLLPPMNLHAKEIPHRHDLYQIMVFEKGNGTQLLDFDEFGYQRGDVHIIPPGHIHMLQRCSNTKGYVLLFYDTFLPSVRFNNATTHNAFMYQLLHPQVIQLSDVVLIKIKSLFEILLIEFKENSRSSTIPSLAESIILLILNQIKQDNLVDRTYLPKYIHFYKLVKENCSQHRDIPFYTKILNVSKSNLSKVVNQTVGKSPSALIKELFNQHLQRELRYTNKQLQEIAYDNCFTDSSHFSKYVKKMFGCSPIEYRKT